MSLCARRELSLWEGFPEQPTNEMTGFTAKCRVLLPFGPVTGPLGGLSHLSVRAW